MRIGGRTCGPGGSGAWPARYAGRYRWMRETGRALRGSGAACDAPARCRRKGPAEPRCGDSKARPGAPAAAGRAGHGSMRDRAPGRAAASSRGRARRRESAGDPVARACRAAPDGARPATPKRSAGFPNGKARRSAIRTLRVSGSGSDGRIRCAHFGRRSSQVPDDAAHLAGVAVAGRGERHSVALPDKQLGSQKSLQLANMPADGAGRDPQFGRRVQEALMPARRFECLERVQRRERLIGHVFPRLAEALEKLSQPTFIAGHGQSRGGGDVRPDCPESLASEPEAGRPVTGNRSRRDEGGGSADVGEAAPGKTIRCCPKGTVGRTAVACKGRAERSGGDLAPIRGARPNDRGCDAFRRGAGEPEDGQPFDGLPAAHSCRSHSFNRTRVRSFADEAVMTR